MKLNVWKRLGIVVTVLWLGVGTWGFHDGAAESQMNTSVGLWTSCNAFNPPAPGTDPFAAAPKCIEEDKARSAALPSPAALWAQSFAIAALIAGICWIAAFLFVWTFRWVAAGVPPR